ncbi:Transcription elongation factor, TFIIS domain-containing protein [Rozella allomycis CSF55]|uniref:Transcription elongation factor n=1 Tax=Rozella allomycis (strain CSF55) TaxID=988480 RepID=A0A075APN4_ROZAC|nr:Transcription elongation factor, TFIIS domain-containing protein [Rozella allomycis CSF55]|eukprot:EPZ32119.1 Transcription elongation factor, TFIIS domain-containing protein [Rozella allomycis CSF55]
MTKSLLDLKKELENINILEKEVEADSEELIKILQDVEKVAVTLEDLKETQMGKILNTIRKKFEGQKIGDLAKIIVLKWKKVISSDENSKKDQENDKKRKQEENEDEDYLKNQTLSKSSSTNFSEISVVKMDKLKTTGDATREKCISMITSALLIDSSEFGMIHIFKSPVKEEDANTIARHIEAEIFREFQDTSTQYKSKFRSRYLNLKDKENPELRYQVLGGVITPSQLCTMTPSELASESRKRENKEMEKRNLQNAKAVADQSAETDQFKCGRCKQRRTKYYQMQTRSADEPMTTYVTCVNCNNRWKY